MGKEENTFLDDVVEVGASLLVGYVISRFVRYFRLSSLSSR